MDWNGDGNINGADGFLFEHEMNGGGGGSSGEGCGCWTWIVLGLMAFGILNWFFKTF